MVAAAPYVTGSAAPPIPAASPRYRRTLRCTRPELPSPCFPWPLPLATARKGACQPSPHMPLLQTTALRRLEIALLTALLCHCCPPARRLPRVWARCCHCKLSLAPLAAPNPCPREASSHIDLASDHQ
eukprot:2945008-Prymnesium_polylepis.2